MSGKLLKGHHCEPPTTVDEVPTVNWVYVCECGTTFRLNWFSREGTAPFPVVWVHGSPHVKWGHTPTQGDHDYWTLEECKALAGQHLSDCDDDGYCNLCGHQ